MDSLSDFHPNVWGPALEPAFFDRPTIEVAHGLIGRVLISAAGGVLAGGAIVEAEAYLGSHDPGSHAATRGVTKRNRVMYGPPGSVYVYFTYGNHFMLNLVCEREGTAGAVLIRALEPMVGIEVMCERRHQRPLRDLCSGPGKLTQALGIDMRDNGTIVGSGRVQVYAGTRPDHDLVSVTGRVGLSEGHDLPLRFFLTDSTYVSRGRLGPLPARQRAGRASSKGARE